MKKLFLTAFVLLGLVLVSQAQTKHTVGEKFGGGIVFYVDETGEHGLIAETIDQGVSENRNPGVLNQTSYGYQLRGKTDDDDRFRQMGEMPKYSPEGSKYNDWRLPTNAELKLLREIKILNLSRGGYWSSDYKPGESKPQEEHHLSSTRKIPPKYVRSVRSF